MSKQNFLVLLSVALVLFSMPINILATCWSTRTVYESVSLCPECANTGLGSCPGTYRTAVQYSTCSEAPTNVAGRTECNVYLIESDSTRVGYVHTCKNQWSTVALSLAALGVTGCVLACLTVETGVGAAACFTCLTAEGVAGVAGFPCLFQTTCAKDDDIKSAIHRIGAGGVFKNFGGDSCQVGG